jgi:hypothetical protein
MIERHQVFSEMASRSAIFFRTSMELHSRGEPYFGVRFCGFAHTLAILPHCAMVEKEPETALRLAFGRTAKLKADLFAPRFKAIRRRGLPVGVSWL